jgi:hypothetical protein
MSDRWLKQAQDLYYQLERVNDTLAIAFDQGRLAAALRSAYERGLADAADLVERARNDGKEIAALPYMRFVDGYYTACVTLAESIRSLKAGKGEG